MQVMDFGHMENDQMNMMSEDQINQNMFYLSNANFTTNADEIQRQGINILKGG